MTTSYDVAGMFLHHLGAPDTQPMRRAIAIWLRFESGNTIIGNNPWNLHSGDACPASKGYCPGQGSLPGQIGNRYAGSGDRNVAVFGTLDAGVKASAQNIMRQGYGYPRMVSEAKAGDALGFLVALQDSSWSAGHYGFSKLVNAFKSGLNYNTNLTFRDGQGGGNSTTPPGGISNPGDPLTFWKGVNGGPGITFPHGHVLTSADIDAIIGYLHQYNIIADDWTGLGGIGVKALLSAFVGREWDEQLAVDIQRGLSQGGTDVANALNPLHDTIFEDIGKLFDFLFDAENWLYILAFAAGVGLAVVGGKLIINATNTPIGEGIAIAS
jgi:hypothetical protein